MSRPFDVVTFDCYGTLVDWDAGIGGAIVSAAGEAGFDLDPQATMAAYHDVEPRVQAESYRSYRAVLEETTRRVGRGLGWTVTEAEAASVPESIGSWPHFPDTRGALDRLIAAGYRLGILSNVDHDLLASTMRALGVEFDVVVTAEDVGSYKPAHGHFVEAKERLGDARWLHAAQSWFHDVVPAQALRLPVAWINRKCEPAAMRPRPDREFSDLRDLADWLA